MPAVSRLGRQLEEVISTLGAVGARFALIGGLALAPHKVIRATQDIDLLTDAASAEAIHQALIGLGYQCLHRSADAANYQRSDERVDFIFAHRTAAIRMLSSAPALQTAFGEIRVVTTEALIGLKLQGFVNDPRRTQDLEDIRALIAANRAELKLDEVRAFPSVQLRNSPRGAAQVSTPANPDLPFVREGGLPHTSTATTRDPFEALDDLMTVVEALCPTWPDRETFSSSATFLI